MLKDAKPTPIPVTARESVQSCVVVTLHKHRKGRRSVVFLSDNQPLYSSFVAFYDITNSCCGAESKCLQLCIILGIVSMFEYNIIQNYTACIC
jgi:hypothetical protein